MSDSLKATSDGSLFKHLRDRIDRLADRPSGLLELGHALAGRPDTGEEWACAAYQDSLSDYVETELNGQPARRLFPDLARHLDLCPNCGQAYVDLLEIALEAEAKPLSVPTPLPALDFSFLPSLTPAERIRQVIGPLVEELLHDLDPGSLADLPTASRAFFQRLGKLGTDIQIRPGQARTLAFGPDLPPALQSLAAAYTATVEVVRTLSIEELEAELGSVCPSTILRKHAHSAAREVGMGRRGANQWAELYAAQAQSRAADLLTLARQMAEHEQPD